MTVYALDIECADWTTFVLGAVVDEHGNATVYHDADALADWYLTTMPGDLVLAHAGGGYDFLWLISMHPHREWTGKLAGSSLVSCQIKGCGECRDTMRLFPGSLDSWTGQKSSTGLDCECGKDCGGFCALRVDLPRDKRDAVAAYCVNDCRILVRAYLDDCRRLADEGFEVYGRNGKPRLTCGAVAWHTAAKLAGVDAGESISDREYKAGRLAYYGGRTEVGAVAADVGHPYDVHSMYPWALTQDVPVGRMRRSVDTTAAKRYDAGAHGAYRATVSIPRTSLPLLPHRRQSGRGRAKPGRLLWTTGTVDGWWTGIELAAAERYGARIESLRHAVTWESAEPRYEPYVSYVYGLRAACKAAGDTRWAARLKWLLNALSGKLAQQPETTAVYVGEALEYRGMVCYDTPPDEGRWTWLGGRVWAQKRWRVASCAHPHQAATLTSRSRVLLLDRLVPHEDSWLYCDTDSTYLSHEDPTGVHPWRLGAWGYEGRITQWEALAPKLYRYLRGGAWTVKARGVPRASVEDFERLKARLTVHRDEGVERVRTGGARFARRKIERTHRQTHVAGTRWILDSGRTEPLHRDTDGLYYWPSSGALWSPSSSW